LQAFHDLMTFFGKDTIVDVKRSDLPACVDLYRRWLQERKRK